MHLRDRHGSQLCWFSSKLKISCYMYNETPEKMNSRELDWTINQRGEQEVGEEKNTFIIYYYYKRVQKIL